MCSNSGSSLMCAPAKDVKRTDLDRTVRQTGRTRAPAIRQLEAKQSYALQVTSGFAVAGVDGNNEHVTSPIQ
jgi:hypothetical protein